MCGSEPDAEEQQSGGSQNLLFHVFEKMLEVKNVMLVKVQRVFEAERPEGPGSSERSNLSFFYQKETMSAMTANAASNKAHSNHWIFPVLPLGCVIWNVEL